MLLNVLKIRFTAVTHQSENKRNEKSHVHYDSSCHECVCVSLAKTLNERKRAKKSRKKHDDEESTLQALMLAIKKKSLLFFCVQPD